MSDGWRALLACVILGMTALLWTAGVSSGSLLPENVAEREGEALLSLYQAMQSHDDGTWILNKGGQTARVQGLPDDVRVGEEISVSGTFDGELWTATWVKRHPLRPAKRRLGLVGLLATAGLIGASARVRDGRVWFRG